MQTFKERQLTARLKQRLADMPAVALLGPRQCGKSTLSHHLVAELGNALYLDLEKNSDLNKLRDIEAFFRLNRGKLICLDEIQRVPDLFPALRSIIDEEGRNGQLLMLGSASRDLVAQSSESLAGRISYLELTPFRYDELGYDELDTLWLQGGFPRSFLAGEEASFDWRLDFIRTFLERDIPQLGFQIPARSMERLWRMCAHNHGQLLNLSKIGGSLGISHHTVRSYIDILAETFLVRILQPFAANTKKRLVKSPKIYIRDSGLLHGLLDIENHNDLLGHPVYGQSWEGLVVEAVCSATPRWRHSFYRTASGVEIDLILEKGRKRIIVECKSASAPKPTRGFWQALADLTPDAAYIVAPVNESYPIEKGVMVVTLGDLLRQLVPYS
ncbi:MAG: ATP-binding protein [Thermodesulfobacteriota bacterium]